MMSATSIAVLAAAFAVFIASATAVPVLGGSVCAILSGTLPKVCTCSDGSDQSATLSCSVNPMGLDQMSMTGVVQPCNKLGATIDLSVDDTKFNVSYAFPQFDANTNGSIPVPGNALFFPCHHKKSTACLTPSQASRSPRPSAPPECMPITTSAATFPKSLSASMLTFAS